MNFTDILNLANSNASNDRKNGNFYKTKFTAPKKESKDKKLSANIQKFLQKQEAEQITKARELEEKRNALLASRDTKAKNKIRKMLKVIKSADKSVIEDAKTLDNTAITLQGPAQPDEDDYGYVSHEANAAYSKLMEKYGTEAPEQKKGSNNDRKKSKFTIKETLERTKTQLNAESSHSGGGTRRAHNRSAESRQVETFAKPVTPISMEPPKKEKPKPSGPKPPPLAFTELLKIAEKKQHEPIKINVPVVPKTEERLMSSKEKLEYEERRKFMESMKKRRADAERGIKPTESKPIPKVTATSSPKEVQIPKKPIAKPEVTQKVSVAPSSRPPIKEKPRPELLKKALQQPQSQYKPSSSGSSSSVASRPIENYPKHKGKVRGPKEAPKRRIIDDDDESEYDSMDSFIDDEGQEDVSSYIKEIFGYDKSRYRDDYDDDKGMESSFAQQMREESLSKKLGLMEDLEDMKQEELAKKKKMMMKKRQKL